ncbi:MAG: response regulator transcription factor [Culicoidibacterales bacterium]
MTRILVVEDDMYILELIEEFLKAQQYEVVSKTDGISGLETAIQEEFDLVLLDVMLPQLDGFSVCKMIRNKKDVPIIMLTALQEEQDQIRGFENLADDFISKPFSFNVLIKRIEALLRRSQPLQQTNVLQCGGIIVNRDAYTLTYENDQIECTVKEFDLFVYLLENLGKVLTRDQIIDHVWGYDYYADSRIVDAHIKNLRKKLPIDCIKTIKGVGYTIDQAIYT